MYLPKENWTKVTKGKTVVGANYIVLEKRGALETDAGLQIGTSFKVDPRQKYKAPADAFVHYAGGGPVHCKGAPFTNADKKPEYSSAENAVRAAERMALLRLRDMQRKASEQFALAEKKRVETGLQAEDEAAVEDGVDIETGEVIEEKSE
jgi:hypothetical protein